ncbi:MAG: L-2-hydroxyglutarate oxidase [Sedimentisphaerales bacterium]
MIPSAKKINTQKQTNFDIVVIGGGIVGLASAYKIQLRYPDIRIGVFEKEKHLAMHQTGHNSGVIHSGLYYKSGSYKAKNCTKGRKELIDFAAEHNIPYEICGKIIVAADEAEVGNLEEVFQNGLENQIEGIEKIGPEQIREIEPFCQGIAGIYVPCTGIIDFKEVAKKLAELIESKAQESLVLTCCEVTAIDKHSGIAKITTSRGDFTTEYLINCTGLQCDRIAKMDGVKPLVKIIPFRGDYYELTEKALRKVRNLIYPVPDPAFPFLGVHFTRMMNGVVECGPNAVFSLKREGYGKMDFSLKDSWDSLTYPGTWKLFLRHWRYGLNEYKRAFFKGQFLEQLQRLIPSLEAQDIRPSRAGVRAQALERSGELVDDFKIEKGVNSIHVLNAPSPAATASLAIGETVSQIAAEHFNL